MKLSQMSRLFAAAFALVTLVNGEAFAQAEFTPTLSVTATGNSVDIRWTPIALAPSYELIAGSVSGQANIANITIPASLLGAAPRIVVTAPNGAYFLRVRAAAGGIKGPWSNEAFVAVGLQPCVPGSTTALTVNVDNTTGTAHLNWTPVPGAIGYRVQWSRFPGATELEEVVTATSTSKTVPMNGTFYVRVVAVLNGCEGTVVSNEAPFTVAVTRRLMSPNEILGVLSQVQRAYPRAFSLAHSASSEKYDFIILACRALYQTSGGTVGCNWRRAAIGDLSMDGISFEKSDGRYYFADVIAGAGGSNPSLYFNDLGLLLDGNGRYAHHGFANPFGVPGSYAPLRTYVNYGPNGGW